MPTVRPRHVITETDQIARALEEAVKRWPDEGHNRARLLVRLVEEGHRAVARQNEHTEASRRAAVTRTRGVATGSYGADYLRSLGDDWPA